MIRSVCLYCGSRPGTAPEHAATAAGFGRGLAQRDIELIYGGGSIGLMGVAARAALAAGGRVTGIIPAFLNRAEIGLAGCTELIVVGSMHERKLEMFNRADAFVALPGGIGTLDETIEVMTWAQLALHNRPILLVGRDFWRPFLALFDHLVAQGFVGADIFGLFQLVDDLDALWSALAAAPLPERRPISERI